MQACILKIRLQYDTNEAWNSVHFLENVDNDDEKLRIYILLRDLPSNSTFKLVSSSDSEVTSSGTT